VTGPENPNERVADLVPEAAGYRVIHLTEREVEDEPDRVVALLRQHLEK